MSAVAKVPTGGKQCTVQCTAGPTVHYGKLNVARNADPSIK